MAHGVTLTRRDGIPAFARQFAATGYTVVTFDYRHWGDSDGHPRGWFSFGRQQSDWRAAVAFARQLDGIDPDQVGLWGFSMSAGMALTTAAADPHRRGDRGLPDDRRAGGLSRASPRRNGVAHGLPRPA
jgi:dienelactone hydrolase